MEKVLLTDICDIQYGYAFDSNLFSETKGKPLVRIRDVVRGYSQTYTTEECPDNYIVHNGDMLIGMDGEFNIALWQGGEAVLNQRVCKLVPHAEVYKNYIFYYMPIALKAIEDKTPFVTVKHLSAKELNKIEIPLLKYDEQVVVADSLSNVDILITKRKRQLSKLDELVKARFVELFGTLENPVQEFRKATLKELCTKITDGKHGGCTQEEGTERYFVGAREIYDDEVHYDTAPEINVAEFEKDYKRCNIEIGDFLIVNTGATIGKSAIATDSRTKHTLLQKSVALLKVKKELLNPVFIKWCYRVNTKMYLVESASAQPNLLLSKINATEIYVPDIELQNQFAAFVEQTVKSKLEIQKGLEKLELLKKALMQKYFG